MSRLNYIFCGAAKVVLALPVLICFTTASRAKAQDIHAAHRAPAQLVQDVRRATEKYLDVNNAVGYGPAFGCVTGPDHGAMGIHYVNGALVGDGKIELEYPEALIYEPVGNARKLVGVEYIVDAATWMKNNPAPPTLDGQDFQFVAAPNRFQLPDFFELHVWAWRDNPNGAFVDWNNKVTCEQLHVQEE
jgi:hypothetical protein